MIPVGVGENEIILIAVFLDKLVAEPSYSGPGINDYYIVTFGSNLETGGITAVFDII